MGIPSGKQEARGKEIRDKRGWGSDVTIQACEDPQGAGVDRPAEPKPVVVPPELTPKSDATGHVDPPKRAGKFFDWRQPDGPNVGGWESSLPATGVPRRGTSFT